MANSTPHASLGRVKRLCWLCVATMTVGAACRSRPPAAASFDEAAETFVRLGLALAERDPDSLDLYAGPPDWRAAAARDEAPLDAIRDRARSLAERIETTDDHRRDRGDRRENFLLRALRALRFTSSPNRPADGGRADHLLQQIRALGTRIDILKGARPRFDDESRLLFGTAVAPPDPARITAVRDELDRRLPGRGSLRARYAAYQRAFLVPEARRAAVVERALAECRRRTRDHLALPADEQLTIAWVSSTPWPAFTRHDGSFHSRLELNAALALTVDGALDIACHEGYPGHHAIAVLQDAELVRRQRRIEFSLQLLFSPDALRSEGLATVASDVAFDEGERATFERMELLPLAGLSPTDLDVDGHVRIEQLVTEFRRVQVDIARRYVDGQLEFVRAAAQLEADTLVAAPDAFLKFVNEFRTYPVAYVAGADLVKQALGRAAGDERWNKYREIALHARDVMPAPR